MKNNLLKVSLTCLLSVLLFNSNLKAQTQEPKAEQPKEEKEIVTMAEQMPEFPGGNEELYKYLSKEIKYPKKMRETKQEAKVFAQFTVNTNGDLEDIKVINEVNQEFVDETIRVIKKMPNWIPGQQNGKPVNVKFTLPIRFKLN
ncbi:MAG: energy transducer TonB [bacterium]|nr:energy transducer TonB [bacterium]